MKQLFIKSTVAAWYLTETINKIVYSEDFSNAAWAKSNITLTSGQTDPNAGTNAFKATATANDATLLQEITLDGGLLNRVFSIYVKRITGTGDISLTANGTTYEAKTITALWARYDVTAEVGNETINVGIKISTSGDEVDVAFAQYENGIFPSTYTATTTTNPYTITQITDADYPANTARGVVFHSGRFFVMTLAGEIYQSALEDAATWSSLEFIQSQSDPSDGVFLAKTQNYIVALKEWSTEYFYDAGNAVGSILSPVQNATHQIGCASDGSVQDFGGRIIFMAQTRSGFGRSIQMIGGTDIKKISTPNVEKILDADDLATVYSWCAQVGSHALYGITLVTTGVTLVYDFVTQQWSFFTYLQTNGAAKTVTAISATGTVTSTAHGLSDGGIVNIANTTADFNGWHIVTNVTANTFDIQAEGTAFSGTGSAQAYTETYFPVVASVRAEGRQYMQDASSGKLFEFSQDAYKDDVGAIAARIRTPKLDNGESGTKFMASAELVGDKIASRACIRFTDDDYATYSGFRPVDLSVSRSRIRRLGKFSRRSFEILHVKDALFRMEALEIE